MMTVREEVQQRIEQDPELIRLRKKIESGKATYADTAAYSNRAGKLLGEVFSRRLPDIPLEEREPLCVELLHDRYIDINAAVDTAQRFMDEALGIHIAPQHAPFDSERGHQIGSSLRDLSKPVETLQRRSRAATETATKSMHDDRMKAESKFRHKAGLDCRITRVAVNGCCPWCSKVAGRYAYGEEPDDIYRRHDNCDCTVTFENGRKRQDVWSKREWEAPEPGAGAGDPVVLTKEQAAAVGAGERVVLTKEQGERLQAENGLTILPKNDIIKTRGMANGGRRSRDYILTDDDIQYVIQEAEAIEIPTEVLRFNRGDKTGFRDGSKTIAIRGDIFPDLESHDNRDQLSVRAALAHEYYGHYKAHPSPYAIDDWRDEFNASYRAALDTPNLSGEDRARLMIDAYDRAKQAGVFLEYDEKARRLIYGGS